MPHSGTLLQRFSLASTKTSNCPAFIWSCPSPANRLLLHSWGKKTFLISWFHSFSYLPIIHVFPSSVSNSNCLLNPFLAASAPVKSRLNPCCLVLISSSYLTSWQYLTGLVIPFSLKYLIPVAPSISLYISSSPWHLNFGALIHLWAQPVSMFWILPVGWKPPQNISNLDLTLNSSSYLTTYLHFHLDIS